MQEYLIEWLELVYAWQDEPEDTTQLTQWLETAEELAEAYWEDDDTYNWTTVNQILDILEEQYARRIELCQVSPLDSAPSSASSSELEQFLDRLCCRIQTEQRTPAWYAQMSQVISASELGTLFGSPRGRAQLVMAKVNPMQPRNQPLAVYSSHMTAFDWGIRFEPVVKQIYIHKYGTVLRELGRLQSEVDTRCTASPDGLVYRDPAGIRTGRLLEIKCPVTREPCGVIPKDYYQQMQMQLHVTGCRACDYVEVQFISPYSSEIPRVGPGLYNGRIALVEKINGQMEYYYGPVNDGEWMPILGEGDEIAEMIPWSVYSWSEQVVLANAGWWPSIRPAIEAFWEDVERARQGQFVVPDARVKKKKEEKCMIVVNKMEAE
jgi:YqaJ-like viral recombinase domain